MSSCGICFTLGPQKPSKTIFDSMHVMVRGSASVRCDEDACTRPFLGLRSHVLACPLSELVMSSARMLLKIVKSEAEQAIQTAWANGDVESLRKQLAKPVGFEFNLVHENEALYVRALDAEATSVETVLQSYFDVIVQGKKEVPPSWPSSGSACVGTSLAAIIVRLTSQ